MREYPYIKYSPTEPEADEVTARQNKDRIALLIEQGMTEQEAYEQLKAELQNDQNPDEEKRYAATKAAQGFVENGLPEADAYELAKYEFIAGPESIEGQVRRYYLKIKLDNRARAESFLTEMSAVIAKGISSEEDIKILCDILDEYIRGALIRWNGHSYCFDHGSFRTI